MLTLSQPVLARRLGHRLVTYLADEHFFQSCDGRRTPSWKNIPCNGAFGCKKYKRNILKSAADEAFARAARTARELHR